MSTVDELNSGGRAELNGKRDLQEENEDFESCPSDNDDKTASIIDNKEQEMIDENKTKISDNNNEKKNSRKVSFLNYFLGFRDKSKTTELELKNEHIDTKNKSPSFLFFNSRSSEKNEMKDEDEEQKEPEIYNTAFTYSLPLPSSVLPSANFCDCLNKYIEDKETVMSLQRDEKTIDAYALIELMIVKWGGIYVHNDMALSEIIYRYHMIHKIYVALEEVDYADNLRKRTKICNEKARSILNECILNNASSSILAENSGNNEKNTYNISLSSCCASRSGSKCDRANENCSLFYYFQKISIHFNECLAYFNNNKDIFNKNDLVSVHISDELKKTEEDSYEEKTYYVNNGIIKEGNSTPHESSQPFYYYIPPIINKSLLCKIIYAEEPKGLEGAKHTEWHSNHYEKINLNVSYRRYDDNPCLVSFRIEGAVNAPLVNILSVLNETDLFKSWLPYYTKPFKLGLRRVDSCRMSRVDQLVIFHVDFPWPIDHRMACFDVWAMDDLERNKCIVVKMSMCHHGTPNYRIHGNLPRPGPRVEQIVVDGSMVIIPVNKSSSIVKLIWNENPKFSIPSYLLDFASKIFAKAAFNAFRRACEPADAGPYAERRKINRDLYQFIEDRLDELELGCNNKGGSNYIRSNTNGNT